MKKLATAIVCLGLSAAVHAQKKPNPNFTEKVAADMTSLKLAVAAVNGDRAALDALRKEEQEKVASAEYGLAEYYARILGTSYATTDALNAYLSERDPAYAQTVARTRITQAGDPKLKYINDMRAQINRLLEDAVRQDDPGAENMLGKDLFFTPWRSVAFVNAAGGFPPTGSSQWSNFTYAYSKVCQKAYSLLAKANAAGWPEAATTLSLAWASPTPIRELVFSGCINLPDQQKSDWFLTRGATLGDPMAITALVEKYREEGNPTKSIFWQMRLNEAIANGVPGAEEARNAYAANH